MHGFNLNPEEVLGLSREVSALEDDLRAIRSSWDGATRDGARSFATTSCGAAFDAFQQELFDQVTRCMESLAHAAQSVSDSAKTYATTDEANAQPIRDIK